MRSCQSFSLIVISLFLLEIISPMAFAVPSPAPSVSPSASPSTTASPSVSPTRTSTSASFTCSNVKRMTNDEVETWWDNTLGTYINQITDYSTGDALNAAREAQNASAAASALPGASPAPNPAIPIDPMSPTAAQRTFYPGGTTNMEQTIQPDTLAYFLNEDPVQTTKQLFPDFDPEVNNYDEPQFQITIAQAMAYAQSRNKETGFMEKLQQFGLVSSTQTQFQLPSNVTPNIVSNLKIRLPDMPADQPDISMDQLLTLEAIKGDKCLLSQTIKGQVTYYGVLDYDLLYGTPSNQTVTGNLSYAPHQLTQENLSWWETLGGYVTFQRFFTAKGEKELMDSRVFQHLTGSPITGFLSLNGGSNILVPSFYEEWLISVQKVNAVQFGISVIAGVAAYSAENNIKGLAEARQKTLERLNTEATWLSQQSRSTNQQVAAAANARLQAISTEISGTLNPATGQYTGGLIRDLENYERLQGGFQRVRRSVQPYLTTSIALGLGWLGPARFIFQINDGMILSAQGANNDQYVKLFAAKPVAEGFRKASDPFGAGRVQEMLASWTGAAVTPAKAFQAGRVFIINKPQSGESSSSDSYTRLSNEGGGWNITTQWKGASFATNFEDVREFSQRQTVTSLPMATNKILPNVVIDKKVNGDAYKLLSMMALPMLVMRGLPQELGMSFGISTALWTFGTVMKLDPDYGKDVPCDPNTLYKLKVTYAKWALWGEAMQSGVIAGLSFLPWTTVAGRMTRMLSDVTAWLSPVQAGQVLWGNRAMEYISNCKDSQYKILTYQQLSQQAPTEQNDVTSKMQPLIDLVGKLKMTQAVESSFGQNQPNFDQMTEILNFKAQLVNQVGYVAPTELYYVHIDQSSWMVRGGLFDQLKAQGCDPNTVLIANDGSIFQIGRNGIKKINPDGSVAMDFNSPDWQKRGLSMLTDQQNAREIVPNAFFNAGLGGCDANTSFITIDSTAKIELSNPKCTATGCIKRNLEEITGKVQGNDLTDTMGKVVSVDTNEGTVMFDAGMARFIRTAANADNLAGSEVVSPALGSTSRVPTQSVFVMGDGMVRLNGGAELGELRTIMTEKGKLEFDPATKEVYVFLYIMAELPAQSINSITPEAVKNTDGNNAIRLHIVPKAGQEEAVAGLNTALDKIAGGAGQGLEVFETADKAYWFTTDADGNPILQVRDKKTGEVTTYPITGSITRDADGNLVVPTDKGPITISLGTNPQNGNPQISVEGAGLKDIGDLLAAKGTQGIMTFNPSTGAITVYNGQDIPLNPDFASKGMGFSGTDAGTQGIPSNNPFGQSRYGTSTDTRGTSISLPSWPENILLAIAMLFAILASVAVVRYRRFEH